jgi:hypothetical protein
VKKNNQPPAGTVGNKEKDGGYISLLKFIRLTPDLLPKVHLAIAEQARFGLA